MIPLGTAGTNAKQWMLTRYPRFGGFARVVSGNVLAQVVTVASLPLLSRLYTPGDFGDYYVFVSLAMIGTAIAPLGFEKLISRFADRGECTAAFLAGTGACLVATPPIAALEMAFLPGNLTESVSWELLMGGIFLGGVHRLMQMWLVRRGLERRIPMFLLATAVLTTAAAMLFSRQSSGGATGLSSSFCLGSLAGLIYGAAASAEEFGKEAMKDAWAKIGVVRRNRMFSLYGTISTTLNTLGAWLGSLLIASIYGSHAAGVASLAMRCMGMPVRLISGAAAQVHMVTVTDLRMSDEGELVAYYERFARDLLKVGVAVVGAITLILAPNMQLVFGEQWAGSEVALLCLAPLYVAQFSVTALTETALLVDRYGLQVAADSGRLVLLLLGLLIPEALAVTFAHGLVWYSVAMIGSYLLYFVLGRQALQGLGTRARARTAEKAR